MLIIYQIINIVKDTPNAARMARLLVVKNQPFLRFPPPCHLFHTFLFIDYWGWQVQNGQLLYKIFNVKIWSSGGLSCGLFLWVRPNLPSPL
jgi:hypothetical protein